MRAKSPKDSPETHRPKVVPELTIVKHGVSLRHASLT
jgi:hypothetical protein